MLWNILFFTYPAHYCPEYFAEINYINWCNGSICVLISYNQLLLLLFLLRRKKKVPIWLLSWKEIKQRLLSQSKCSPVPPQGIGIALQWKRSTAGNRKNIWTEKQVDLDKWLEETTEAKRPLTPQCIRDVCASIYVGLYEQEGDAEVQPFRLLLHSWCSVRFYMYGVFLQHC